MKTLRQTVLKLAVSALCALLWPAGASAQAPDKFPYITCSFDNTLCGLEVSTYGSGKSAFLADPSGSYFLRFTAEAPNGSRAWIAVSCDDVPLMPCTPALDHDLYVSYEVRVSKQTMDATRNGQVKLSLFRAEIHTTCSPGSAGWAMYGFGKTFAGPDDFYVVQDCNSPRDTEICRKQLGTTCTGTPVKLPADTWVWIKERIHRYTAPADGDDTVWFGSSSNDQGKVVYDTRHLPGNGWNQGKGTLGIGVRYSQDLTAPVAVDIRNLCVADVDTALIAGCH